MKMKALRAFNIFLYLLIAIILVQAELIDYATNDENLGIIIKKLNEIEEKVDAMDHKLIDLTNAEYRNVRQWIDLSEKEFEMQQSLQKINKKFEEFSETQVEMKTEVIGLTKNIKNLIESQRETSFIVNDSQQNINSNLEGNQKSIENLKNKSDEVVQILEAVQKDQGKLSQQCTISDEQCSKTFISKLEGHSGSLNKIVQEKHKNLLENQIEIMKDFKKNTETIAGLSDLIQKSIPNSVELASQTTNSKNILTAEQLKTELEGLNKTIIDLGSSINAMIKFSLYNATFDGCSSALKITPKEGIYKLKIPNSGLEPFNAYCKLSKDRSKGWTVIQRRLDGSVDFYRNWTDYKNGFGNLNGEYWLGLEKIYAMTSKRPHILWIGLGDFSEGNKYAKYSHFEIGSEDEGYYLKKLGNYSGDAGDSMIRSSSKAKFSTPDVNNDNENGFNCAVRSSGGWWFDNCNWSVLNGKYNDTRDGHGINWSLWHGFKYSLKYSIMAISDDDKI